MFTLHYLIMKFLGYVIYLMFDLNDFLTKFCLNNFISYVIYIYIYKYIYLVICFCNCSFLCGRNFLLAIHKMIRNKFFL